MHYFKNEKGKPFVFDEDIKEEVLKVHVEKHNLTLVDRVEFESLLTPKFDDLKTIKINSLRKIYIEESAASVTYKEVVYKGGEASASAIAGAVQLAQSLKETSATIIDIEDKENDLTFEEAMELSALIAKAWRVAFFKYKELKRAVLAAQSVEELELIKW